MIFIRKQICLWIRMIFCIEYKKNLVSVDIFLCTFSCLDILPKQETNKKRMKDVWQWEVRQIEGGFNSGSMKDLKFYIPEVLSILVFCFPFQLYSFTLWNTKYQTFHIHISSNACTNNTTNLCKCFKSDRENKKKWKPN